jgi:DNA-binding NarL/FixJ family response regulator
VRTNTVALGATGPIFQRLGVTDRVQAAMWARDHGMS